MKGEIICDPGWSVYSSTAAEHTAVVKASPGRLRRVYFMNTNASSAFTGVVGFKASALVTTDVIVFRSRVANRSASTTLAENTIDFGPDGITCPTGISLAQSTTDAAVTVPGGSDFLFVAIYL